MKRILWTLCLVPVLAFAQETKPADKPVAAGVSGTEVMAAKVGTGVTNRELDGEASTFKADVGKVFCWMKVKGEVGSKVTHAWFKGTEEMGKVELEIKYPVTRTWSAKTITPEMKGDWRVDIVGADGTVLQSLKFTVEG